MFTGQSEEMEPLCSGFCIITDLDFGKYLFSSLSILSVVELLGDFGCPKIWSVFDGQCFVFFNN